MAVYFMNIKSFGRNNGSSAPSAAAYRAGERIRDERTGKTYDHSARRDVMGKGIVVPSKFADADLKWARDRSQLWNAAEGAESRKNARVAREFLVALPYELSPNQRLELVQEFSQKISNRYQFAVDYAIHAPREAPDSDPRNYHAHLLATTREVTLDGLGAKTAIELGDRARGERGLVSGAHDYYQTRELWAHVTNDALKAAHIAARVDHRSLAAQGIDREPQPRFPRAAVELERLGYRSYEADRLRAQYSSRVEAREQRMEASERRGAAAEVADSRPRNLEDIRREARENWLKMREQSSETPRGRGRDDEWSR